MAKLLPPIVEGSIPAFYSSSEKGIVLTIPFSMNRGVSKVQVGGFAMKAKTVQSSTYLYTKLQTDTLYYDVEGSPFVRFLFREPIDSEFIKALRLGQFYKFQIAYIDALTGEIGHYSVVTVGKYTTMPEVYIEGMDYQSINMSSREYIGVYDQTGKDYTERVYSYRFDVYDNSNNLFATSGDHIHNSSNDAELYMSYDRFTLSQELEINKSYYIRYVVKTINGLEVSSPRYRLMRKYSINPEMDAHLDAKLNFDNGYIDVKLVGNLNDDGMEALVTGAFLLTRSSEDNNYTIWDEVFRFNLTAQLPSRDLWRDFTAEQGKTYQYSLQQYNDAGLYSNRMLSNKIYCDFEDAFLFDGEKQLKIRYNPKVATFKKDVLEAKIDTIGSKHPFIFRNGNVEYQEFSISGLISYFVDEEHLFMDEDEFIDFEKTTNLISKNLANERLFKLKTLEWLTNGKPKVFRSPTEGNYIVRLMNVTMTPTDQLGRLLHTFNATAYEIADYDYEKLSEFDFIQVAEPEKPYLRWETIDFASIDANGKVSFKTGKVNRYPAYTLRLSDMQPGSLVQLIMEGDIEPREIRIGATGSYYLDTGVPISAVIIPEPQANEPGPAGSMTYSYYSVSSNMFNKIENVTVYEVPCEQFIGKNDIIQSIEQVQLPDGSWIKNPKLDIIEFFNIKVEKRAVVKLVQGEETNIFYLDREKTQRFTDPDPLVLYQLGTWSSQPVAQYNPYRFEYTFSPYYYLDYSKADLSRPEKVELYTQYKLLDYDPNIYINGNQISVDDIIVDSFFRPGKVKSLTTGNGVVVECAYQVRNVEFSIENDLNDNTIQVLKETYLNYQINLQEVLAKLESLDPNAPNFIQMVDYYAEEEAKIKKNIKESYDAFIIALYNRQEEERKVGL